MIYINTICKYKETQEEETAIIIQNTYCFRTKQPEKGNKSEKIAYL